MSLVEHIMYTSELSMFQFIYTISIISTRLRWVGRRASWKCLSIFSNWTSKKPFSGRSSRWISRSVGVARIWTGYAWNLYHQVWLMVRAGHFWSGHLMPLRRNSCQIIRRNRSNDVVDWLEVMFQALIMIISQEFSTLKFLSTDGFWSLITSSMDQ